MESLRSIDLNLAERMRDPEFRRHWFRAELETSVPRQFREMRERRELTQSELATVADMKQSAISRFESSTDAKWKLDTLMRLAEALRARLSIRLDAEEEVVAEVKAREDIERVKNYAPTQYGLCFYEFPFEVADAQYHATLAGTAARNQYARAQQSNANWTCPHCATRFHQSKSHGEKSVKSRASVQSAFKELPQGLSDRVGLGSLIDN